ncbi:MAG: FAD-dependent oxidoreductase [Candidatus Nanohaloarchaea archaeon]
MGERIQILGGGINGITTGVLLQLLGYDTRIVSKDIPHMREKDNSKLEVASEWAAGVIAWPVMVDGDNLGEMFGISQKFFGLLNNISRYGVMRQDLFRLGEGEVQPPPMEQHLIETEELSDEDFRPSAPGKDFNGYRSGIYLADLPFYMPQLYRMYRKAGGRVVNESLTRSEFLSESAPGINCTGYWSRELFDDSSMKALKGHILHVKHAPLPEDGSSVYSYVLDSGEHTTYCFPRNGEIVLGGTHLEGEPDPGGEWQGEELDEETVRINGEEIPERIKQVNSSILGNSAGINIEDYDLEVYEGYRPYREKGLRIERQCFQDAEIIHNYGHGGSGVTLSWGSALEVENLVSGFVEREERKFSSSSLERLSRLALNLVQDS